MVRFFSVITAIVTIPNAKTKTNNDAVHNSNSSNGSNNNADIANGGIGTSSDVDTIKNENGVEVVLSQGNNNKEVTTAVTTVIKNYNGKIRLQQRQRHHVVACIEFEDAKNAEYAMALKKNGAPLSSQYQKWSNRTTTILSIAIEDEALGNTSKKSSNIIIINTTNEVANYQL